MAKVAAVPRPALIVDTCALLDLVRAPVHLKVKPESVRAARDLLSLATASGTPTLEIYVCSRVLDEWADNVDPVTQAAIQALTTQLDQQRHLSETMAALQGAPTSPTQEQPERPIVAAKAFADQILAAARHVAVQQVDLRKAGARALAALRPASKGNSALADCVIFETALRIARKRPPGSAPIVFLSSNTKDYYLGTALDPTCAAELAAAGMTFATSWIRARYALQNR